MKETKKKEISIKDMMESQEYQIKRNQIQTEINANVVNIDRNEFKKTLKEKQELAKAKLLNNPLKLEVIQAFSNSKIPNWGGFIFNGRRI